MLCKEDIERELKSLSSIINNKYINLENSKYNMSIYLDKVLDKDKMSIMIQINSILEDDVLYIPFGNLPIRIVSFMGVNKILCEEDDFIKFKERVNSDLNKYQDTLYHIFTHPSLKEDVRTVLKLDENVSDFYKKVALEYIRTTSIKELVESRMDELKEVIEKMINREDLSHIFINLITRGQYLLPAITGVHVIDLYEMLIEKIKDIIVEEVVKENLKKNKIID